MDIKAITVDPETARDFYQTYKSHVHWSPQEDAEIKRTYQLLAQGRSVIRAVETIASAGIDVNGLPKLALCRADAKECIWYPNNQGGGEFACNSSARFRKHAKRGNIIKIPDGTWNRRYQNYNAAALLPPIPNRFKPKRGLANYHVLWEAEWKRVIPADPYLLRQIGNADMWLVMAAWDLTEVERMALSTRLNA